MKRFNLFTYGAKIAITENQNIPNPISENPVLAAVQEDATYKQPSNFSIAVAIVRRAFSGRKKEKIAISNSPEFTEIPKIPTDVNSSNPNTSASSLSGKISKKVTREEMRLGSDLLLTDNSGITELMFHADCGNVDEVQRIMERGDDVDEIDAKGRNALMYAAASGHAAVVRDLTFKTKDIDRKDVNGITAVINAAAGGHTKILKRLLDSKAQIGNSALLYAIIQGHSDTANYLGNLEGVIDVNHRYKYGMTPIMHAAARGHLKIVQNLTIQEADLNAIDKNGMTPLIHAAKKDTRPMDPGIINTKSEDSSIDLDMDIGLDIDFSDIGINKAVSTIDTIDSHLEVIKYLLSEKVKIDQQDSLGNSALIYATEEENFDIAQYLISVGADVEIANKDGQTALDLASLKGHQDLVSQLVIATATKKDSSTWTELQRRLPSFARENKLTPEAVNFLAIILDDDLRKGVVSGFNRNNPGKDLDLKETEELRKMRRKFIENRRSASPEAANSALEIEGNIMVMNSSKKMPKEESEIDGLLVSLVDNSPKRLSPKSPLGKLKTFDSSSVSPTTRFHGRGVKSSSEPNIASSLLTIQSKPIAHKLDKIHSEDGNILGNSKG